MINELKKETMPKITQSEALDIFRKLDSFDPPHLFWQNGWMFTRDVFTNESCYWRDIAEAEKAKVIGEYVDSAPRALRRYIRKGRL